MTILALSAISGSDHLTLRQDEANKKCYLDNARQYTQILDFIEVG